ncbi:chromate transporter [Rossellomorea marisflavi]|jgi:chromate transporter|uniref:chromate transporter n=1 Tax=Rossellomorea marisflavi TaxID=189381 RepID=UPI0011540531|nr:chromate transporter [Rossellomorea marisflavi]MDR4935461.1 chromate transporter [Rossellomorea marisflavi]VXC18561.1 chromate transporter subunit C [Bacillus sp. 349Y]
MTYVHIFMAFFVPNVLGYGGGPSSIPLIQAEVVDRYGWLTDSQFSEMLALANALPGPINTKMAGYIGYQQGGVLGAAIGLFSTIAPSLLLMLFLLGLLMKFKDSPKVKNMTTIVRPTIAILLGIMTMEFLVDSYGGIGIVQTLIIGVASYLLLERWKVSPAFVIGGALVYGAVFLGG